jgi:hypothetical protein
MAPLTRNVARLVADVAAVTLLLIPAIWNGFPLLEYDTGGYLARWFEHSLGVSRSTTYGLFVTAGWPLDFWPVVILQAAAAVWIVGLLIGVHRFSPYPAGLLAVIVALAVTTALPWLASELLTDIFAGLGVLAFYALIWHGDRIALRERIALIVFTGFVASTHSATYAVLLAVSVAALFVWMFTRKSVTGPRLAEAAGVMLLGALMLISANYVVARQIAWTPGGFGLVFARMLEDGIVTRYLDEHCPDPRFRLCAYRNELPHDADEFLWNGTIFDKLGGFAGLGDEMHTIVLESLRDYPGMQIKAALVATAKQLVTVGTGEGIVPLEDMWHTHWTIEKYAATASPAMHAARQERQPINFATIDAIHKPIAWAAMALLPVLMIVGFWNANFADIARLSAAIAVALLANAAVCGVISNPHDRYGSRIVWIAVFAAVLAAWRWIALARERPIQPRKCFDSLSPCA